MPTSRGCRRSGKRAPAGRPEARAGIVASFFETVRRFRPERYHKQKLALLLSAMRHDALTRGSRGHPVLYRFSERWYDGALAEVRETFALDRVEVLAPAEAEVRVPLSRLPWLEIRPNSLFVTQPTSIALTLEE